MLEWQSIGVIVAGILIALFTLRLWLPSLLDILRRNRIEVVWADKKYSLTISQAESLIRLQDSALTDEQWGTVSRLASIPGVRKVELGPKLVHGRVVLDELVFRVTVAKKRPLHELRREEVIPVSIGGVRTDVIEESAQRGVV